MKKFKKHKKVKKIKRVGKIDKSTMIHPSLFKRALLICLGIFISFKFQNAQGKLPVVPDGQNRSHLSYSELGRSILLKKIETISQKISVQVTPQIMPHEVKSIRYELGSFKALFEIFAFAQDPTFDRLGSDENSSEKVTYKFISSLFDEGYGLFGSFKDLYDWQKVEDPEKADYKFFPLKERRIEVLNWKSKFESAFPMIRDAIQRLSPQLHQPTYKNSKFFWGAFIEKRGSGWVYRISPRSDNTGIENFRILITALIDKAILEYDIVSKLGPSLDTETDEVYHDFRKRLRGILTHLISNFPEVILNSSEQVETSFDKLNELVLKLGIQNDYATAYRFYLSNSSMPPAKVEEQRKGLEASGRAIKIFFEDNSFPQLLEQLKKAILF